MFFDLAGGLSSFFVGMFKLRRDEKYLKAAASISLTIIVAFFGTWGASITALYPVTGAIGALVLGFGAACLAVAGSVLVFWRNNKDIFKGTGIALPTAVVEAIDKSAKEGFTYEEKPK